MVPRGIGGVYGRLLRREGSALTRPTEAERTGTFPAQRITLLVCDRHDGVIEAGLNKHKTKWNVFAFPLFELLTLAGLGPGGFLCSLRHGLLGRFLFAGNGSLAGAFAGTGIGVGALATDGQVAPVT